MKLSRKSLAGLVPIAAALLVVVFSWLPVVQERADELTDQGLNRALVTFAVARGLNAAISVIQGTELSVQPLGVGITLTLGQVLDPINDLVEQFSSLMLFASVAFGVQKMLLKIAGTWAVSSLVTVIAIAWAASALSRRSHPWLTRLFVVVFLIRFAIPLATIGSGFAFDRLLAEEYAASQESLEKTTSTIEAAKPEPRAAATPPAGAPQGEPGRLAWMTEPLESGKKWLGAKMPSVEIPDFEAIKEAATNLPKRIVTLIAVFVMQTVALPLLLLWLVYRSSFAGAFRAGARNCSVPAA